MINALVRSPLLVVVILTACPLLVAQSGIKQFTIEVTDHTGAVVQHAQVKLHPQSRAVQANQETNEYGRLTYSLPKGSYELSVSSPGFKPWTQRIQVNGLSDVTLRIVLEAAEMEQIVDVSSPGLIDVADPTLFWFSMVDNTLLPNYHLRHVLELLDACCATQVAPPAPSSPGSRRVLQR